MGLIFGFLLSRNIILRKKLKNERDLVYQKNKRIRSFTGTIVHDLKNPVSAIHGFSGILLEKGDTYQDKTKTFLNRGIWNGKQIISGQWVEKSATPFPGGHGINIPGENSGRNHYFLFLVDKTSIYIRKKINMLSAGGWGGQHIMVLPEVNMLVVLFIG